MWNDYLAPMIYLDSDNLKTIQIGLAAFRSIYNTEYNLIMAGTVCSMIPIVLIYVVAQNISFKDWLFQVLKG